MRLLPLLFLPLLACDFVTAGPGDPVDPTLDGVLRCGETEDVTGFLTGDRLPIEVAVTQAFEVRTAFADPNHSARVRVVSDFGADRLLEIRTADDRFVPGRRVDGGTAELELIAPNTGTLSGTVAVVCPEPGEDCNNIADDDADGLIDCADPACGQEPRCVDEQVDLEVLELACGDDVDVTPPSIGTFDEQRILYAEDPGADGPMWHFRGGAELVLVATEGPGTVSIVAGSAGLACAGPFEAVGIQCLTSAQLEAGVEATFDVAQTPLYLEPDDAEWASLAVRLDCE